MSRQRAAKKPTTPRRQPRPRSAASQPAWTTVRWPAIRRAGSALLWVVLLAALAAGWSYGLPWLSTYAVAAPPAGSEPRAPLTVVFRELPTWLGGDCAISLEHLVREAVGEDPLDREGLVRAREALLATGWFDSVAQVRRTSVDRVDVVATYCELAALVRSNARDWLVDSQGRLLPMSWSLGEGPQLAVILGATAPPPRTAGEQWPGQDVAAGLRVLDVVDRQPWAQQVQAIDVAAYPNERSLRLITDRGSVVRWGRPPGEERAAEVSAAMKLDFLEYHHRRYGHIDGGLSGELDVTRDVAVLR